MVTAALAVGVLTAGGVFLVLRPGLVRITFGFVLLGHAVNVLLLAAGGTARRGAPLIGHGAVSLMADPLPQAFVLTAIVITFGITVYLLGLASADPEGPDSGHPPSADPGRPGPEHPPPHAPAGPHAEHPPPHAPAGPHAEHHPPSHTPAGPASDRPRPPSDGHREGAP
ncbi:sodium:proton antiporter [Streptomyces fradiae]|uniref:sodium:proton antiporter n=1 Tax=Streptomyces fradiae TaxID=1906 RepID=UPI002942A796|nr:sodium:proton antiporter [Streptomyces fradiae]WOI61410.1 sodium:proton antiporter [Streptomyces fradiae]